jgi:flavoprotein
VFLFLLDGYAQAGDRRAALFVVCLSQSKTKGTLMKSDAIETQAMSKCFSCGKAVPEDALGECHICGVRHCGVSGCKAVCACDLPPGGLMAALSALSA